MTPNGVVVGVPDMAEADLIHLRRCVELASEAVDAGDFPFGSVLVAGDGAVLAEDRNRENSLGDATRHPEFELARWAAANMTAAERAAATVFTSGEHCPMCSAAHAWVGLGRIVFVSSSEQLTAWPSSAQHRRRCVHCRSARSPRACSCRARCRGLTSRSASSTTASAA
jgi:tRNA(Arg) A34 adenosine deaminase TadA